MSSLPVSMKRIPSRTTEKKGQHPVSNYNTICCHGNQWSDLAEFPTHPCMSSLPASMKRIRWKIVEKMWWRHFLHYKAMGFFQMLKGIQLRIPWSDLAEFRTHSSSYVYHHYLHVWNESNQKRSRKCDDSVFPTVTLSVAMETSGCIWPNLELIQALIHFLITCKYEKDSIKNRENVMTSFSPL